MNPPARGFEKSEYERRLQRVQQRMKEEKQDALLLTSEANFRYFSGFLTAFWQSPTRPWFLVVPQQGAPIAVIPAIGAALMRSTWIRDIRTWESPQPDDEGVSLLADTLREVAGKRARIGTPMGAESFVRMPLHDYARLNALLPDAVFADAAEIIRAVRLLKSAAEIEKIAHICAVADAAFADTFAAVQVQQPLTDVFRHFKIALLQHGADDVPYVAGAAATGGYQDVISPPTERPLATGDILMLDTGAVYDGYFCDFDRNLAIGEVSETSRRAHRTLYAATDAGLAAARPGATCADVFNAMRRCIAADGYADSSIGRFGHGLGMELTEFPSLTANDRTVLAEDMVITLEPALMMDETAGMVHEENIVIRADGAELLSSRVVAELPVLE